ncbi:MAG: metallophosphoesterase family protein [Oscillospiraceae bacterium]|nr:metallophosphoesterase family protein [Oscillospiraceae bacterium]
MKRIVAMAADKRISYAEMGDALLGDENVYSEDNLRKAFYVLNKVCGRIEDEVSINDGEMLADIKEQTRLLEEAKVRFRDERMAYNTQNRNSARLEQKLEYLENVLTDMGGERFKPCVMPCVNSDNDLLVVLSDLHIGATFSSAFGEYDSDIAKRRLNDYLSEILKIRARHNSQNVYVVLAGDLINGDIHKTIAVTNRENVIDQVKLAVDYISAFCFELSQNFANVYFTDCAGNHSRIDRKEDALHDERLDSLIAWTASKLLAHVGNFKPILDGKVDTGIARFDIRGKEYVAVHGDYDGMGKNAMARLMLMLGVMPYAVVMGHRHFPAVTDESGVRVVQGGSLSGSGDDYTIEKRLSGKPSQTVCVCTDKGIECIYPITFD